MAHRLLVLSKACFESVNRTPYRILGSRHGVEVHVAVPEALTFAGGSKAPLLESGTGVTLVPMKMRFAAEVRLEVYAGVSDLVTRTRPTHILVDSDPASMMTLAAARNARRTGARLLCLTCENLPRNFLREAWLGATTLQPRKAVAGAITQLLSSLAQRRVDHLFTISRDGTRVMEQLGYSGRITQTPLGFDAQIFHPHEPKRIAPFRARIGLDRPTIAYFGRVVPEKGVDLLVRALAGMLDQPWQFLIDDFERYRTPYMENILALLDSTGVKSRTVFFRSSHAEIADYMNAADIVALPSISTPKWKEQYGRVAPEAMACGKIVVASDSGALPELVGEAGFTFPEGDVEALRGRLVRILETPSAERERIGASAALRARQHLSAERQAEILLERLNSD